MRTFQKVSISFFLVVAATVVTFLAVCQQAGAADCIASVSPDFNVHIPAIQFGTDLYSGDMTLMPTDDGNMWFQVTAIGPADPVACDNPAILSDLSAGYLLYLPSAAVGSDTYWATLQYFPGGIPAKSTMAQAKTMAGTPQQVLKLVEGNIKNPSQSPLPPDKLPHAMSFDSKIHGTIVDASNIASFNWEIKVSAYVPLNLLRILPPLVSGDSPAYSFSGAGTDCATQEWTVTFYSADATMTCTSTPHNTASFTVINLSIYNAANSATTISLTYDVGSPTFNTQCTVCLGGQGCYPQSMVLDTDFANAFSILHSSQKSGTGYLQTDWNVKKQGSNYAYVIAPNGGTLPYTWGSAPLSSTVTEDATTFILFY